MNQAFGKIKLSGMSAEDAAGIKEILDDANEDICTISELYDSNDPIVKEVKRLYNSVNSIFTQLDPYKDVF